MATTMTFNGVLETGMSFLRVTAVILLVSGMIGGLGLSLIDSGDTGIGTLLLLISGLILIAGVIGLMQKLISDAFLEGFKAAKEDGRVGDGTKMDVNQTLTSGFQVIGVVLLTAISSGILFGIGADMIDPYSRSSTIFGTLFLASGCTVWLAMIMGILARVIAEGVSFGASSTGVSFEGASLGSEGVSGASIEGASPTNLTGFMDDWSDSYKRLVFSTAALFFGFILDWYGNFTGLDILLAMGKNPLEYSGDTVMITYYIEQINLKQGSAISNITKLLFWLLPWIFVATFGYAWYGHTQGNEEAASPAGKFHFGAVLLYAVLFVYDTTGMDSEIWDYISKKDYFLYEKLGTWVAGLSGLGLWFRMDRVYSGGNGSTRSRGATFEEIDADGDGSLSKQEVEASEEIPDGSFEEMDADGDGSVSEDEFDDFDFDFDFDEEDDEVPSLEDMTKEELKTLCKERGLSASGNKTDILARLLSEDE